MHGRQFASTALLVAGLMGCRGPDDRERKEKPARAKDMLERVGQIQPELERVRELKLSNPIPAERQTVEQLAAMFRENLEKHASLVADEQLAYVALGLLPPETNLGEAVHDAYTAETAAFYSVEHKKIVFVSNPENEATIEFFVAHELTHGLQDQNFDLATFSPVGSADDRHRSSDASLARKYLVEGDAMLAAIMHGVYLKTGEPGLYHDARDRMRKALERLTAGPLSKLASNMAAAGGSSTAAGQDKLEKLPAAVVVPMVDPYLHGALFAFEAYTRGGWKAVDALYQDPPTSTEQVLHPERMFGRRDQPRPITLPTVPGYELVLSDVMGELMWTIYFERWEQAANQPAVNWGGDRFAVLRAKGGALSVMIATVWDGPYDAKMFADAYAATLAKRFLGEPINIAGGRHWIVVDGTRVFIFHGSDEKVRDLLVDETSFAAPN